MEFPPESDIAGLNDLTEGGYYQLKMEYNCLGKAQSKKRKVYAEKGKASDLRPPTAAGDLKEGQVRKKNDHPRNTVREGRTATRRGTTRVVLHKKSQDNRVSGGCPQMTIRDQ